MDKRVEGSFASYDDIQLAIQNMLDQGYTPQQLVVISRNEEARQLVAESAVEVVVTSDEEESLWDKIVAFFTVELDDDDDDEEELFENYGIDEDTYERFEDALENGEYVLLIDSAPPAQQEHTQYLVRDGILPEEEDTMNHVKPDWTDADDNVKGDVEKHSIEAGKKATHPHPAPKPDVSAGDEGDENEDGEAPDLKEDVTGQPIEAEEVEGDPTMADDNQNLADMQFDHSDSHPEAEEDGTPISTDPFGGETVVEDDASDVEPDYKK
ncbi:general stress protein [Jeotgalibaca arthritidis]|uniref:general stress protein n=1 Tax=Jeotgalibaca arthritidis TaxID=1868794 RepID=UPI0035A0F305